MKGVNTMMIDQDYRTAGGPKYGSEPFQVPVGPPRLTIEFAGIEFANNFRDNGGMNVVEFLCHPGNRLYPAPRGPQQEESDMAKKANNVVATVEVVNNGWQVTLGMFGYRQNQDDVAAREQRHVFTNFREMATFLEENVKPLKDAEN
jgi:hypothetical protein